MIQKNIGLLHVSILSLAMHVPSAIANRLIRWRFPEVEQHSPGVLLLAHDRGLQSFVDVRGLTIRQVREQIAANRRQQPQARVALVCDIGYCSSKLAAALVSAGYKNVVNLEGGLRALRQFHHEIQNYAAQRTA